MQNQKYILPIGFYDLLGDEARVNQEMIDVLLNSFYVSNYQLIKTPLVEFEESLSNKKIDEQSFKMVDNFSGKTLVLRSDITPQIARLMATKLQDVPMPIRLCYVGDVLKIKNDNLYADRQLTQVGIELIGEDSATSNLEVIESSLAALKKIKLANLMINFCCPQFLDILLGGLSLDNIGDLRAAVVNKNISAIKKLAGKFADDLILLALENSDFVKIGAVVSGLPVDKKVFEQLEKWQKTINDVKKNHLEINFSVDIFGDDEFSYHNQIGFTIFAEGLSYPIARGGRYLINQKIPAVGATIYINNLRKILVKG
jgi:ATP phosphoribosyltransferase regulatory subunit